MGFASFENYPWWTWGSCLTIGIVLGCLLTLQRFRRALRAQAEQLRDAENSARTDALTGLWNRRGLDEFLTLQTAIARRYGGTCSLLLIDVDHFKQLNDIQGHAAGDKALRLLARQLSASVRESDLVTRFGGDEFALVLPHTDLAGAALLAERLQQKLAGEQLRTGEHVWSLTFSVGAASFPPAPSASDLMDRADRALYRAKQSGRNCVCIAEEEPPRDVTRPD